MKILVRGPNWVGDCVLANGVVRYLMSRLPEAEVEVAVRSQLATLFSGSGAAVRPVPSRTGLVGFVDASSSMLAARADAALLLAPSTRAALETFFAVIPIRLGYPDDRRSWWLTHPVRRSALGSRFRDGRATPSEVGPPPPHGAASRGPFQRHLLLEGLALVEELVRVYRDEPAARVSGVDCGESAARAPAKRIASARRGGGAGSYSPASAPVLCFERVESLRGLGPSCLPRITTGADAKQEAGKLIEPSRRAFRAPLVGIHPLSRGGDTRNWPLRSYLELIKCLRRREDPDLVIFGGPDEGEAAKFLQEETLRADAALPSKPRGLLLSLAGREALSLPTFAAMAEHLALLVTNDTGPMHLAAAMGTRVVAIFGSTLPEISGPVGSGHRLVCRPGLPCAGCYGRKCVSGLECLKGIPVPMVYGAVKELLESAERRLG